MISSSLWCDKSALLMLCCAKSADFVNRFLTLLSNLFSGIYLTDMETCYKAFKSEIVQSMQLKSMRFGIEVEFEVEVEVDGAL